ncbi:MAG: hypothetical protein PVJ21_00225 [Anaerolineales bacterium]|jgi:hypothetical protein
MSKKNAYKLPETPTEKDNRENPSALPGWPGYRTRDGRSGYDPIDTRTEAAHVSGSFLQNLFAGQLRINNPIVLIFSGVLGLVLVVPLILAIFEVLNGNLSSLNGWIPFLIAGAIGLALLFNFTKNLIKTIK